MSKRNYHLRTERWRDVKGYEGIYQVSNKGRVKSLDRYVKSKNYSLQLRKGKILKGGYNTWGYLQVNLCTNNKCNRCTVHRLVSEAFIPNPDNKPEVEHKGTHRDNNCVWNLKWVTHPEQFDNPKTIKNKSIARKGKYYGEYGKDHQRARTVLQFDLDDNFIKEWETATQASKELNINRTSIVSCCSGRYTMAGGYKWNYIKNNNLIS